MIRGWSSFDFLKYDLGWVMGEREEGGGWGRGIKWFFRDIVFSCVLYNLGWCRMLLS